MWVACATEEREVVFILPVKGTVVLFLSLACDQVSVVCFKCNFYALGVRRKDY